MRTRQHSTPRGTTSAKNACKTAHGNVRGALGLRLGVLVEQRGRLVEQRGRVRGFLQRERAGGNRVTTALLAIRMRAAATDRQQGTAKQRTDHAAANGWHRAVIGATGRETSKRQHKRQQQQRRTSQHHITPMIEWHTGCLAAGLGDAGGLGGGESSSGTGGASSPEPSSSSASSALHQMSSSREAEGQSMSLPTQRLATVAAQHGQVSSAAS